MGASMSMIPAWRAWPPGFTCFLITFTSATTARFSLGITRRTLPRLPRSRPLSTSTVSSRLILNMSDYLWRERNNLQVILLPQLPGHRPEDPGPLGIQLVRENDQRVVVEANARSVGPSILLRRPHDHRLHHVALLHRATRRRLLHGADDHITNLRVLLVALQHTNHQNLARTRIVGHATSRVRTNHDAFPGAGCVGSTIGMSSCPLFTSRATTQCFSRLRGRLSRISTTSPM